LQERLFCIHELSRGSLDLPFVLSVIAHGIVGVEILSHFGTPEQKRKYLEPSAQGTRIIAVGNTEEAAGTDIRSIRSKIIADRDHGQSLHLHKSCITNAAVSSLVIASAWNLTRPEQPRIETVLVESSLLKIECMKKDLIGFRTGDTGNLFTPDTSLSCGDEDRIGPAGSGFEVMRFCFNLERLAVGAMISGVLAGMLEDMVSYSMKRESQGKPLSDHQYVQSKINTVYEYSEILKSILERILLRTGGNAAGLQEHSELLSLLKIKANEFMIQAAEFYYELHGHRSFGLAHTGQKLVRDSLAFKTLGGSNELQKIVLFNSLCERLRLKIPA
jgi:alkylation response protein AidB-like acyl-CoA dehydrogenase